MPITHYKKIYCNGCGKLLKVEEFGDAMTLEELIHYTSNKKKLCWKCKLLGKKESSEK